MPLPLIPIILGAASLAAQGGSMYTKGQIAEKEMDYNRLVDSKRKREQRREAIMRAIGANRIGKAYNDPLAPDMSGLTTRAGLLDMGGKLASMGAGYTGGGLGGAGKAAKVAPDDLSKLFSGMA
jgi:hypothetical protein